MIRYINTAILSLVLIVLSQSAGATPQFGYTVGGQVGLSVNNLGYFGNAFSTRQMPSCEYPRNSGGEHLYLGGIWVGARASDGSVHVSTSAQDANGLLGLDERREFREWADSQGNPSYRQISNVVSNINFHPDALATDHIECVFKDNATPPAGNHTPLGLKVTMRALSWDPQLFDDFVILDLTIINDNLVTQNALRDIYIGIWLDTTVGNTNFTNPFDPHAPNMWNFNDDLNGGWRPGDFISDPSLWMMHEHDADGDSGWAPSWVGCRLLDTSPQVTAPIGQPPVSYNSWRFRGVPDKDDWYIETGDTTNTLLPGKYQTMSNGHFDVGVTPEDDFSQIGNWSGLLTTGPFPSLAAGDSIRAVFAISLGMDANQLRFNSRVAKLVYDSGYVTPVSAVDDIPRARTTLAPAVPNPFNPSTTLSFNLSASGPTLISVHDLQGRLIRILVDGHREAGPHTATWDGRDGSGRTVASGTYLVRLLSGGESTVVKVVLSK